jgi:hypothetical protein
MALMKRTGKVKALGEFGNCESWISQWQGISSGASLFFVRMFLSQNRFLARLIKTLLYISIARSDFPEKKNSACEDT